MLPFLFLLVEPCDASRLTRHIAGRAVSWHVLKCHPTPFPKLGVRTLTTVHESGVIDAGSIDDARGRFCYAAQLPGLHDDARAAF